MLRHKNVYRTSAVFWRHWTQYILLHLQVQIILQIWLPEECQQTDFHALAGQWWSTSNKTRIWTDTHWAGSTRRQCVYETLAAQGTGATKEDYDNASVPCPAVNKSLFKLYHSSNSQSHCFLWWPMAKPCNLQQQMLRLRNFRSNTTPLMQQPVGRLHGQAFTMNSARLKQGPQVKVVRHNWLGTWESFHLRGRPRTPLRGHTKCSCAEPQP